MKQARLVLARLAAPALLALAAADACAQTTLYKLVDRNGKVTYAEKPPKDFDGKVIRIDIDPNANTATLPTMPRPAEKAAPAKRAVDPGARLSAAEDRLEAARKALADAQENPRDEDVQWIANKGGGVRRVPTEAHARRLAALEKAVQDAEDEVRKAGQAR